MVEFTAFPRFFDDAAQVSHAGGDSADRAEMGSGGIGNNRSEGSFAAAGRPP